MFYLQAVSPGLVETQFALRARGVEEGKTLYVNNPVSLDLISYFTEHNGNEQILLLNKGCLK